MKLIKKKMPYDYVLAHVTDIHEGPITCFKKGLTKLFEKLATINNYYMVFTGDAIDAIAPNDKRFNSLIIDPKELIIETQAKKLIDFFKPVAHKILAWGLGNHEYIFLNVANFGKYIADGLNVPYGGFSYKFTALNPRSKTDKVMHKCFLTHGSGSINSQAKDPVQRIANMKAKLKLVLSSTGHSDCIYMGLGHTHKLLLTKPTVNSEIMLTDDGESLHQSYRYSTAQNHEYIPPDCRWYGNAGSFLKTYVEPELDAISYSEMRMYPPTELGWIEIYVQGGKVVDVKKIKLGKGVYGNDQS